jgi:hypothetical protein
MGITEQRIGEWGQFANAGGIRRLKLLAETDVQAILDPVQFPTLPSANLIVQLGAPVYEFCFAQGTCGLSVGHTETENGDAFELVIGFEVPKLRADVLAWIVRHLGRRWVALLQDFNGTNYLAGDVETPLELTTTQGTGNRPADRNVIRFQLRGRQAHPVWLLESFDNAELFPNADWGPEFDLSFTS